MQQFFNEADAKLAETRKAKSSLDETEAPVVVNDSLVEDNTQVIAEEGAEVAEADSTDSSLLDQLAENQEEEQVAEDENMDQFAENHPLYAKLQPINGGSALSTKSKTTLIDD